MNLISSCPVTVSLWFQELEISSYILKRSAIRHPWLRENAKERCCLTRHPTVLMINGESRQIVAYVLATTTHIKPILSQNKRQFLTTGSVKVSGAEGSGAVDRFVRESRKRMHDQNGNDRQNEHRN